MATVTLAEMLDWPAVAVRRKNGETLILAHPDAAAIVTASAAAASAVGRAGSITFTPTLGVWKSTVSIAKPVAVTIAASSIEFTSRGNLRDVLASSGCDVAAIGAKAVKAKK